MSNQTKKRKNPVSSDDFLMSLVNVSAVSNASTTSVAKKKQKQKKLKPIKPTPTPTREWWKEKSLPKGIKWKTLSHNGVVFAPAYEPHGVNIKYNGKSIKLTAQQEEVATFYARYLKTHHAENATFNQNFFDDFKKVLNVNRKTKHTIQDFALCNFTPIATHLEQEKETRKNRTKADKTVEKEQNAADKEKYGFAMVDAWKEQISNFRVEPPGLFLGRGKHPKTGRIKKRIFPEDVTLNIGKKAKAPPCPIPGHKWGKIIHNNKVTWLAMWKENINGDFKYVWLAPSSKLKGLSDMKKFETARKLKKKIKTIRRKYNKDMKSTNIVEKQLATAAWLVDNLALRVGNEKNLQEKADTVGCCNLRVEHVSVDLSTNMLKFDFLAKDSMRYVNTTKVPGIVAKNIHSFIQNKTTATDLFDIITTTSLNAYFKGQMPGLTAKVFRTYNASSTLQDELLKTRKKGTLVEKISDYKSANREVAILCNHKRSLPPTHSKRLDKFESDTKNAKALLRVLQKHFKLMKQAEKDESMKLKFTTTVREYNLQGKATKKEIKLPKKIQSCENRIKKTKEKIHKLQIDKEDCKDNAEVALGTSKINYNDPRITVAWAKTHQVPIEKVFSAALRKKFPWAQMADGNWKF